jgi:Domain of unknown function (DUF4177)
MMENIRWEYRVFSVGTFWSTPSDEQLETSLNDVGQEGWEVVSTFPAHNSSKVTFVARRLLTQASRRQRSWPGD